MALDAIHPHHSMHHHMQNRESRTSPPSKVTSSRNFWQDIETVVHEIFATGLACKQQSQSNQHWKERGPNLKI
jgi:hypothetical protein